MRSWRTTGLGIATILVAIGTAAKAFLDNDPSTIVDLSILGTQVAAGIGLIMARDSKVTSEDEGIK